MYDPDNPNHKYPSNDAKDLPNNVKFGNSLGEWEDEMSDGWRIIEIIIGGAKSYSYIKYKPKTDKSKKINQKLL
jgi:hypothetical protein